MYNAKHIRPFQVGDESALYQVFFSAIHHTANKDYTPEQIEAWAPTICEQDYWNQRMRNMRPFIVEAEGRIVGYASMEPNGYVDHFFVSALAARTGVGSLLMQHIHTLASAQNINTLTADVSRTAQPFFLKHGFAIVEQRAPIIRSVVVPNAFMRKLITA